MLTILWGFSELQSFPAAGGSGLKVDACWLISVVAADGRLWQFIKVRQQWSLPHLLPLPFLNDFPVACEMLLDNVLPTELLSKSECILSNPATALPTKFMWSSQSLVVVSIVSIASSPGVDPTSGNHFPAQERSRRSVRSSSSSFHSVSRVQPLGPNPKWEESTRLFRFFMGPDFDLSVPQIP